MRNPFQVLVVDDSALMRSLIRKMLEQNPDIEVPAIAMNGQFALDKIKKFNIDVITLDLEMPIMNGMEFLKERQNQGIDVPVIVFSSIAKKGAKITMDALSLGASDFILKPTGQGDDLQKMEQRLSSLIKVYGGRYRHTHGRRQQEKAPPEVKKEKSVQQGFRVLDKIEQPVRNEVIKRRNHSGRIEIVVLGISTGGPNALRKILPEINEDLPVPILIVQHMPPGFTEEFAKSLDRICSLEVREAKESDIVRPGRIFIAPGGQHLSIRKKPLSNIISLSKSDAVNGHRPSVDVLFSSVAEIYNNNCLAVLMTGMGKDGVREMGTIYREGGITIAQDRESCIVPGMPGAAIKEGIVDRIVSLDRIPGTINELVQKYR